MKLRIGDLRHSMGEDLVKALDNVVSAHQNKRKYYILVNLKLDPLNDNVFRQKIMLFSHKPDKMIGSMCFFVDNVNGVFKKLWVLPDDIPRLDKTVGDEVGTVLYDARDMPVMHDGYN